MYMTRRGNGGKRQGKGCPKLQIKVLRDGDIIQSITEPVEPVIPRLARRVGVKVLIVLEFFFIVVMDAVSPIELRQIAWPIELRRVASNACGPPPQLLASHSSSLYADSE